MLNLEIQVYVFFQWIICRFVVQFIGRLIFVILSVYIFIAVIKRVCIRILIIFQLVFQVLLVFFIKKARYIVMITQEINLQPIQLYKLCCQGPSCSLPFLLFLTSNLSGSQSCLSYFQKLSACSFTSAAVYTVEIIIFAGQLKQRITNLASTPNFTRLSFLHRLKV